MSPQLDVVIAIESSETNNHRSDTAIIIGVNSVISHLQQTGKSRIALTLVAWSEALDWVVVRQPPHFDKDKAEAAIDQTFRRAGTALWDAIVQTTRVLAENISIANAPNNHKAILFFITTGAENASKTTKKHVTRIVESARNRYGWEYCLIAENSEPEPDGGLCCIPTIFNKTDGQNGAYKAACELIDKTLKSLEGR